MKQLITTLTILFLFAGLAVANDQYPRQKITLSGGVNKSALKTFTVKDLENFQRPAKELRFFDPYNKNIETLFYGFYLKDFVKTYASPHYKFLRIGAIDGYKVDVPRASIEKENLFVTYKDKAGFLTVDRMGPARIIAPANGVINKDLLLKIGVYWVWQIKTLEFIN